MSRRLPFAAAVVVFVALFATAAPVGFVRDEGYYFEAAKSCEAWLVLLLHDPFAAIRATEQYWSYNFEHPGLAKLLFASSHLAFTSTLHFLPDAQSWRLPGFFFAALLAFSRPSMFRSARSPLAWESPGRGRSASCPDPPPG
ncbi:MAG: hypothetical protein E6J62_20595 [Deltaproteobacteria bacterium]|nr:MAG: hypothetical protein E6J62_20595 [Deltaproteobacteria bacterium]